MYRSQVASGAWRGGKGSRWQGNGMAKAGVVAHTGTSPVKEAQRRGRERRGRKWLLNKGEAQKQRGEQQTWQWQKEKGGDLHGRETKRSFPW